SAASTTAVLGAYTITGSTRVASPFAAVNFLSASPITTGALTLVGGPAYFGSDATASSLTINDGSHGGLTGPATLTVTGLFTFIGGVMSGTGRTIAQGGIEMIGPDAKWVVTRTLVNVGTAIVTARQLELSDGGLLHNLPGATFDIRSDLRLTYFNGR